MVTFPYNTTDFAFTLNDVFLNFSTTETNSYFDLEITIKYFEFFSSTEKTKVLEYKIPLLNQNQSFNVGKKIHRYLANLGSYNNVVGFQYKTAKVSFIAVEKQITDNTVIDTVTLNDVKFVAGHKPNLFIANKALLSLNTALEKVSKKGVFNTSFLLPAGNHVLEVYKNNVLETSVDVTATATDNVYLHQLIVSEFAPTIADVFTVKIKGTTILKEVVIGSASRLTTQLMFLDTFKLPRSVEFTGEFSKTNEYDQITHTYKRNLIEVLEVVTTEKIKKLTIATGFLLPTETNNVDELLDCKKVFLVNNNATVLEMAPIAKKLVLEDSTNESFTYNLEFQINKNHA